MNRSNGNADFVALGLMSGTSLDGVDAALIETDGEKIADIGPNLTVPYPASFRSRLTDEVREAGNCDRPTQDQGLIHELTMFHCDAVVRLLDQVPADSKWSQPDVIGFHGHTTLHRPDRGFTQQIGDAQVLASRLKIPVVSDFRQNDVSEGGEGAPLAPIYHAAMFEAQSKPIAVVNIGGISNITFIGERLEGLIAFDTGPGNGLLDRWVEEKTGALFDADGYLASKGISDQVILDTELRGPFFKKSWPKSLDRSDFNLEPFSGLNTADGAATLVEFTVKSIVLGIKQCPEIPKAVFITGGGRHNKTLMSRLGKYCPCPVYPVENQRWDGDSVEAQAFAFIAVRSMRSLPITFSGTTGVLRPTTGGKITQPC